MSNTEHHRIWGNKRSILPCRLGADIAQIACETEYGEFVADGAEIGVLSVCEASVGRELGADEDVLSGLKGSCIVWCLQGGHLSQDYG
jgi:hypothetical protein